MSKYVDNPTFDWASSGHSQTISSKPSLNPPNLPNQNGRILSGESWVYKYRESTSLSVLRQPFKSNIEAFIKAIKDASGRVDNITTYRPPQRAYLMHYAYLISRGRLDPAKVMVPRIEGVNIEWDHGDNARSIAAAQAMCDKFKIKSSLRKPPSMSSRHIFYNAVDMTIFWHGNLTIARKDGTKVTITTSPPNGTNHELIKIGLTYGVKKLAGDPPHWSDNGH